MTAKCKAAQRPNFNSITDVTHPWLKKRIISGWNKKTRVIHRLPDWQQLLCGSDRIVGDVGISIYTNPEHRHSGIAGPGSARARSESRRHGMAILGVSGRF